MWGVERSKGEWSEKKKKRKYDGKSDSEWMPDQDLMQKQDLVKSTLLEEVWFFKGILNN